MPTIYPDCMMPDGAEPCGGYRQLYEQHTALAARLAEATALLREASNWRMAIECVAPELGGAIMTLNRIDAFLAPDSEDEA